ncbi:gephyrin-like molybdotransferase Glp [Leifsonia shinshuensis]|uniref:molybdopterin molybdotransferase MoeA n=1 Tax=Leifsonia shinshuensis TaxID=150026 RepID=UPI00285BEE62|nr:gephyrin-like molybdotransferase Glp [Leifsonia shinshuensis]MDR6972072.1 molybdopterin molybdotransferase [Leifsonia shinshuensis]
MEPQPHTVESYRDAVLRLVNALPPEHIALDQALGRSTAEAVTARLPVPAFDNAAMDGYAVRSHDVANADRDRPATLTRLSYVRAGSSLPQALHAGEARPVMTGAPVPPGADLVIPVESTASGRFDDSATVEVWPSGRANIRRRGEDIAAGALVIPRGATLGPRDLALLAATGHDGVLVHRKARVAIVATGDELSSSLPDGGIPDSNSVYLRAAIASVGADIASTLVARDDVAALREALDTAARDADLIVSTGGVGPGTHDLAGRLAAEAPGGTLATVAMRPGRPQAHATWRGTPWLALPGNPTAAFVSFEAFVRPVLGRLGGGAEHSGTAAETVSVGWESRPGAVRFVPLSVGGDAESVSVSPFGPPSHASHSLSAMFRAPLIAMLGAETADVRPGQLVRVIEPA